MVGAVLRLTAPFSLQQQRRTPWSASLWKPAHHLQKFCRMLRVLHNSSLFRFVSQRSGYTEFIPLLSVGENLIWKEMQPRDLLICDSDLSLLLTVHLRSCLKGNLTLLEINENCKWLDRVNSFPWTSGSWGAVMWRSLQVKEMYVFQWCLHQAVHRDWKFQNLLLMWKYTILLIFSDCLALSICRSKRIYFSLSRGKNLPE